MRLLGLYGDREQLITNASLIQPNELVVNSDNKRLYIDVYPVGSVYHGDMPDEESMLALFEADRGCYPGDWCYRTDLSAYWQCIANSGVFLVEWKQITPTRQSAVADVSTTVGSLSVSNPPTQAEVEAIRDELAATNATLNTFLSRLRATGGNGLIAD